MQLNCLFKSLFRLTIKKLSLLCPSAHLLVSFPKHIFVCKSRATRPFVQQTSPVNNKEDVIFHHSRRVIACYPSITVPNGDHCANVDHMVWLIPAHVMQWNVESVIDGMGMQPLESEIRWWVSTDTPFGMSGMARAWPVFKKIHYKPPQDELQ